MKEVLIILPNQLHESNDALQKNIPIYLVEEYMFFNQYNFHKQKLVFQRASMKNYENYLCLLYTSPSPRDGLLSRMPSSA